MITGEYDEKCDIWSCGVILYILLTGKPPFYGANRQEVFQRIQKGVFTFQDPRWAPVSKAAKDLIRAMLTRDPAHRASAEDAYNSQWIQQRATSQIEDNSLSKQTLQELAAFSGVWKIRQAGLHYIVCQMETAKEIQELRKIFIKLDTNGDGTLSYEELGSGFDRLQLRNRYNVSVIIEQCDANFNGFIDYTEFLAAAINWKQTLSQEWIEVAFRAYDIDNNGRISLEEVKSFIGDSTIESDVWESMFREADVNGDGFIDLEEFRKIMLKV